MIIRKSKEELEKMRRAGALASRIREELREKAVSGMTTQDLDALASDLMKAHKAKPAFLGYRGYPAHICTSVNDAVVHGIPSGSRRLQKGDILSVDLGVVVDGFVGDCAATFSIGDISDEAKRLLSVTKRALEIGLSHAVQGNRLGDLSSAIGSYVESQRFSVVRDFVGHGIGRAMHEDPQIPNYGKPGTGPRLEAGMVFAIEPMVNAGDWKVRVLEDGWTVVTQDGSLSAHFEDMVAVTENGPDILTQW